MGEKKESEEELGRGALAGAILDDPQVRHMREQALEQARINVASHVFLHQKLDFIAQLLAEAAGGSTAGRIAADGLPEKYPRFKIAMGDSTQISPSETKGKRQ